MATKNQQKIRYYVNSLLVVGLMLGIGLLTPVGQITPLGMQILGPGLCTAGAQWACFGPACWLWWR